VKVELAEEVRVEIPMLAGSYSAVVVVLEAGGLTGVGEAPLLPGRPQNAALRSARETAELDLAARAAGVRVADLLGGARRESIRCSALVTAAKASAVAAEVGRFIAAGFAAVKLKAANGGGPIDRERLGAARWAAGHEVELRLDFNGRLSVREALAVLPGLRAFAPITFEQPLAADAPAADWAQLGDPAGLAADESLAEPGLSAELAAAGVGLAIKLATVGGPRAATSLASAATGRAWAGSSYETWIGLAAALHAACAFEQAPPPCGLATAGLLAADLASGLPVERGFMALPRGPGLGVELDRDALRRYRAER
jgi:L-alanine-DL-glutamate epimerase-like enolase superfamily enzyme